MIFDGKSLSHGFFYCASVITTWHNPDTDPEMPAPDPAGVIRELEIPNHCNSTPHGNVTNISSKQRLSTNTLFHYCSIKLTSRPIIMRREISINNY